MLDTSIENELDSAMSAHRDFVHQVVKSLVCRSYRGEIGLGDEAHYQCVFGRWYYSDIQPPEIKENTHFQAIERSHKTLHQLATKLLSLRDEGVEVSTELFDSFYDQLDDLFGEFEALRHDVQSLLYHRDPLTGAYTRQTMEDELSRIRNTIQQKVSSAALIMIDLDHFKRINDSYGHLFGDDVLKSLASIVESHVRKFDKLFRFGGEEFLIVLPAIGKKDALEIAEGIREGIQQHTYMSDSVRVNVTASFGVTMVDANCTSDANIEKADKALYRAKENGRNRVEFSG